VNPDSIRRLNMVTPSLEEFKRFAQQGNLIPVFDEVHFDWETPISAFRKIDDGTFSFLLESVEGGEKWARFSFMGSNPSHLFRIRGDEFEILRNGETVQKERRKDPLRALEGFLKTFKPVLHDDLPRFFGGAVGYCGYDIIRSFERIPELLPQDLHLPDCLFMITDTLLVFDNLKHKMKVISNVFLENHSSLEEAYREAAEKIERIVNRLRRRAPLPHGPGFSLLSPRFSTFSKEDFMKAVQKAKEYIRAGDAIQVVLSQRFFSNLECDPFDIYRALRSINPSPYLFYLKMDDTVLLGASPEVMVRLEESRLNSGPSPGRVPGGRQNRKTRRWKRACWPMKKRGPSISCLSIWGEMMWAGCRKQARST